MGGVESELMSGRGLWVGRQQGGVKSYYWGLMTVGMAGGGVWGGGEGDCRLHFRRMVKVWVGCGVDYERLASEGILLESSADVRRERNKESPLYLLIPLF